jgi:hypothetical protein
VGFVRGVGEEKRGHGDRITGLIGKKMSRRSRMKMKQQRKNRKRKGSGGSIHGRRRRKRSNDHGTRPRQGILQMNGR